MENKTIKLLNSNLEIALRLLVIMNVHKNIKRGEHEQTRERYTEHVVSSIS